MPSLHTPDSILPAPVWATPHPQGTLLKIHLKPNARQSEVTGTHEDALAIRLAAKPVEGEANTALIAFLAQKLNLPKSRLTLLMGTTSRHKQVLVLGLAPENLPPLLPT